MSTVQNNLKSLLDQLEIKVEFDRLEARVGNHTWKIKKEGHVDPIRRKIIDLQDEFSKEIKMMEESKAAKGQRIAFAEKINKEILELALIGFSYDEAARNPDIGPKALDYLAVEVSSFLVEYGGMVGYRHSLTLSKLALLMASNTSTALKKSTSPSDSSRLSEKTSSEYTS